ncbi:hypothetical protein R6Z07F_020132 [Ovis aries]
MNLWSSSLQSVFPRSPASPPQQLSGRNYNIMTHEPKEDNCYIYPSFNCDGFLETAKPEANYEEFVHPRRFKIKLHSKRETINWKSKL